MEDLAQKLATLYYAPGGYAGATELASKLAQAGVKVDEDVRKQIRAWLAAQPVGGNVQTRPLPLWTYRDAVAILRASCCSRTNALRCCLLTSTGCKSPS